MSIWPFGNDEQALPTAEDLIKKKKTVLREAIASGTVENVHYSLESLRKANVDIAEVFHSDTSLLQTLGSRVVRSDLITVLTLLDAIAEFDPPGSFNAKQKSKNLGG